MIQYLSNGSADCHTRARESSNAPSDAAARGRTTELVRPYMNIEGAVQINLTEADIHTFRDLLHDYLPALKLEVARTESHEFRHLLVARQDLCERLLRELQRTDASGAQFSSTSRLADKDVL